MLLPRAVSLLLLLGCSLVSCSTEQPLRSIPEREDCPSKCMCVQTGDGMMDVICPSEEDINALQNAPEDIDMQTAVEIINVAEVNNDTRPEEATGEDPQAPDASVENTEQPMPIENKAADNSELTDQPKTIMAFDDKTEEVKNVEESKTEDKEPSTGSAPLSFPEDVPVAKDDEIQKVEGTGNDVMQADEPTQEEENEENDDDEPEPVSEDINKEAPVDILTGDSDANIVAKKGQNLGFNLIERTPSPSVNEQGDEPIGDDQNELQDEDSTKEEAKLTEAENTDLLDDDDDEEPESQTDEINVAENPETEVKENEQEDNTEDIQVAAVAEKKDEDENSKPVVEDMEEEDDEEEEEQKPTENEDEPTGNEENPSENEDEKSAEKVEAVEEKVEAQVASDVAVAPEEEKDSSSEEESSKQSPDDGQEKDKAVEDKTVEDKSAEDKSAEDKAVEDKTDPEAPLVFPSKTDNSSEENEDSSTMPAAILSRMEGAPASGNIDAIVLPDGEILINSDQMDDAMSGKMISDDDNTLTTDPQQSTASWVILGLILGTFVCVLGYAAIRGRMDKKEEELISSVKPAVIDPKINRKPDFEGTELKVLSHPLLLPQDEENVKEFKDDGALEQVVVTDNSDPNTFPFIDAPNAVSKPPRKAPRPLSVDLPSPNDMSRNDFSSAQSPEPTTPTLVRAKMVDNSPQVARIIRNVNETKIEEEDEE